MDEIFFLTIVKFHKMSTNVQEMSELGRFQWGKWIMDHGILRLRPTLTWCMEVTTFFFIFSNSAIQQLHQVAATGWGHSVTSKPRALEIYFPERISYGFTKSECRVDASFPLCMTLVFAKRIPLRSVDFRKKKVFRRNIRRKSPPHGSILFTSTEVMHRGRDQCPLQIDIRNSYQNRKEK